MMNERTGTQQGCQQKQLPQRTGRHEASYARLVAFLETGDGPWEDDDRELAVWVGDWNPDDFSLSDAKDDFDR